MKRSKRIEILDARPVNKDGFIREWPEMGFAAMKSPYDPSPSIRVENGVITELDGKKREDFDFSPTMRSGLTGRRPPWRYPPWILPG